MALPPSKKTRALLAYLAVSGRTFRRDYLCRLFWDLPDDPRGSLRWSLSRIRKLVDTPEHKAVIADRETVAVDLTHLAVDLHQLESALETDCQDLATLTRLSSDLGDEFLADLELPDHFEFEAWRVAEKERARQLCIRLLDRLTGALDPAAAVPHARRWVGLDGTSERAWLRLLRALADSGQRREAVELHEVAVRQLQDASVAPSPRLIGFRRSLQPDDGPAGALEPASAGAPVEASRSAVPPEPAFGERKQISVLVVRFAAAALGEDPEAFHSRMLPVIESTLAVIGKYQGTVSGIHGDEVVALFGVPRALEDDAIRACFAAAEVADCTARISHGALAASMGVHAGSAVVHGGDSVEALRNQLIGPILPTTFQLAREAAYGTTLVTEAVAKRAEGFLRLAPAGEGRPGWQLLGVRAGTLPFRARAARGLTPFVGREPEIAMLRRALLRFRGGPGELIGIVGEPGVGKSRLVHEMLRLPELGAVTLLEAGTSSRDLATPYQPLLAALGAWAAFEQADDRALALRQAVEQLGAEPARELPVLLVLFGLRAEDSAWLALPAPLRARRTLDALLNLITALAARGPVVLIIEDLHWLDPASQQLLDELAARLPGMPLLLIVTFRPEYQHGWSNRSWFTALRVDPLEADPATAMLMGLLGERVADAALLRRLVERTQGTPLFIEETARALLESDDPGRHAALAGEVPVSVHAVLAARIDRLDPEPKRLLQIAAVIGRDVAVALLGRTSGMAGDRVDALLARLQEAEFLFESRFGSDRRFTFKHALTQEVAYRSLLRDERRLIHAAVVAAIEALYPQGLDDRLEQLTHHALRGEQWQTTVRYATAAAERAVRRSAHQLAIELITDGLAALGHLPDDEARDRRELALQKLLGVAMMAARGWGSPEVSDAYTRAQQLCERLGDDLEYFAAARGKSQFHMISGQLRTALELGRRCETLAAKLDDPGAYIETHHVFWTTCFYGGDCGDTLHHSNVGIGLYQAERDHALTYRYSGHDPGVCARAFAGMTLWLQGRPAAALARCREGLTLARSLDHPMTTALAHWGMSFAHLFRREADQCLASAEREIAISREYRIPLMLGQGLFQAGWALSVKGQLDEGLHRMSEAQAAIEATGAEMGLPYLIALYAEALGLAGRYGDALESVDRALAIADDHGANFQRSEILRHKARLLLHTAAGNRAEADVCLAAAMRWADDKGALLPLLQAAATTAGLSRDRRLKDQARRTIARLAAELHEVDVAAFLESEGR